VTCNFGGNSISVLLGNGDGTFQSRTDFPAGPAPDYMTIGDFNGDGNIDVAVANASSNDTVGVLLGNGDGTFQSPKTYYAGGNPFSIAAADLKNDGTIDLVVANEDTNTLGVLLGNGDGSFQPVVTYNTGTGTGPWSVTVGDFNADGIPDVALADGLTNDVSVFLGNGDGTFGPVSHSAAGMFPTGIVAADLNGDGFDDLVTANNSENNASVLLNDTVWTAPANRTARATPDAARAAAPAFGATDRGPHDLRLGAPTADAAVLPKQEVQALAGAAAWEAALGHAHHELGLDPLAADWSAF
jgi:hypothetical protein